MNRLICVSAGALALAACGGGGGGTDGGTPTDGGAAKGEYKLTVNAFTPHDGKKVLLKVKDATSGATLGGPVNATVSAGTANLTVPAVLETGKTYRVDFFVDNDNNGACDACGTAGGDHAWRRSVAGNAAGVSETFPHDTNWTPAVAPF